MQKWTKSNRIRRLKHIEAFSAVISTGSISAAARQLGVSQPAVSQLIKALEDAIGAPLFIRRNGAIFPTSRAENLRDDAVVLLSHLDRFQAQLDYQKTGLLTTIRMSATMSVTSEILPLLIEQIRKEHAEAKFYVSSIPLTSMIEALVQSRVDYAFHTRPLDHPSVYCEELAVFSQVAVLPTDHPLAAKPNLTVDDLQGASLISSTRNDPSYHYLNKIFQKQKISVTTVLQSPFASFAIKMAPSLGAITFANEFIARIVCARERQLTMRSIEGVDLVTPFFMACPEWQQGTETHALIRDSFETFRDLEMSSSAGVEALRGHALFPTATLAEKQCRVRSTPGQAS